MEPEDPGKRQLDGMYRAWWSCTHLDIPNTTTALVDRGIQSISSIPFN